VVRTSAAFEGGISLICLTIFFQAKIIPFHTREPFVADGRWTISHAAEGNQYPDFGSRFQECKKDPCLIGKQCQPYMPKAGKILKILKIRKK